MASTARSGSSSSSSTASPLARTEAHRASRPGQLQPVLDQRNRPVQGGDHRVFVAEKHRGARGGLGDVDYRHVEELLEPLAAVLAVAGLDDRVERLGVASHGVHDCDRSEVALEVALHGVGTESRCQTARSRCPGRRRRRPGGDGVGHGCGGVDVGDEDAH